MARGSCARAARTKRPEGGLEAARVKRPIEVDGFLKEYRFADV